MKAGFYYSRNLPEIRNILEGFHDGGVLVRHGQKAVKAPSSSTQLVEMKDQYSAMVYVIQKMDDSGYTIRKAYQEMMSFDFNVNGCQIGRYILERMSRNDIKCIVKMGRDDISTHLYSLLRNSQANSSSVGRNFSILGKLPATD